MKEQGKKDTGPYNLVVVGSSASGIEALSILLETLPDNFPAPVVLAQHPDPTHSNNMDQILQKRTTLPVESVTTSTSLENGVIYVLPANHHVNIKNHHIEVKCAHLFHPRVARYCPKPVCLFVISQRVSVPGKGGNGSAYANVL
jgi:chemotaxis response regulator CheB